MKDVVLAHSDERLSDIYSRRLNEHFKVHRAVDGISGLRLVKNTVPGMIIAQYELPYLSGLGLLRFVRKHPTMTHTPFIILSQQGPHSDALSLGANEWIKVSDSSVDELIQKVIYHLISNKPLR